MADGPVFTSGGQLPEGNCNPFFIGYTQTVICVSSPHNAADLVADVVNGLPGHAEILHELQRGEVWNNGVPPVGRSGLCPNNTRPPPFRQLAAINA